ncbi:hypothetical protein SSPO_100280 [Streptomyces antimycoticus]|uniref:Uncharacterized protein n=1 Tax=Streptomyces antimycoticus TaxID=68175 RepID=A0A499V3A6_9ACTN|nr:hypothetical protein SSPO_100280 [Streptomyces antimycoticus]
MEAPAEPKGQVVDLMSAFQDSVRAAKQARGEEGDEGEGRETRPAPTKKAPAKMRPTS